MHKLKERLAPIQLSDTQKEQLKIKVKQQAKKPRSFVPIILPAIVMLSIFFIVLQVGSSGDSIHLSSSSPVKVNDRQVNPIQLSIPTIIWSIVNSILLVLTYSLFKRNLKVLPRWQQHARLQEWHAVLHKPVLSFLLLFFSIFSLWIVAILSSNALWLVQICFVILLMSCLTVWELYKARNQQWSICPHCGERLTRMQILRKSFIPFRERCDHCNSLIYVHAKDNQNLISLYVMIPFPFWIHTLFDLHLITVILFIIGFLPIIYYFILPYQITFSDKEEKLW